MKRCFLFLVGFLLLSLSVHAQDTKERNSIDINEIEVWTKSVHLSANGDTAIVELYLQSYLKNPREFKMNTFASGLLNGQEKPMWYHSMQMGKVVVRIEDRQNYLHYLLTRDEPVLLTIKTPGWKKQWGKPQQLKLAIEDFQEPGKILEYVIDL